jgi:hypothetical protein
MKKVIFSNIINFINKYNNISLQKLHVLKKGIKFFKNIFFTLIIYIYMPELFLNTTNLNDNDKMILMACFVVFSGIMSYIIQNYQWKPPGSESGIIYDLESHPIQTTGTGWKNLLWRILMALR